MIDSLGRKINYLRISVTDRCNLRCSYCMPEGGIEPLCHKQILSLEEILRICCIMGELGINRFKITGGEPLVRRGVVPFIGELKKLPQTEQVTLTTNGLGLLDHLPSLFDYQLDGINLSLDTLRADSYRQLTKVDGLDTVLTALEAAAKSAIPLKINCVPLKGFNEDELVDIAGLAKDKVKAVRFIELMPLGLAAKYAGISSEDIKTQLEKAFGPLISCAQTLGNGPAKYYSIANFQGKIGFISALSHCFCDKCNRLRLTADGKLKLCLAHDDYLDIKTPLRSGASDTELKAMIKEIIMAKPLHHDFIDKPAETKESNMFRIGG